MIEGLQKEAPTACFMLTDADSFLSISEYVELVRCALQIASKDKEIRVQTTMIGGLRKEIASLHSMLKDATSTAAGTDNLRNEISSQKEKISSQQEEISSQKKEISSHKEEISTHKKKIGSLKTEISSLLEDISSQKEEIISLQDEISSHKEKIGSLQEEISSLGVRLQAARTVFAGDDEMDQGVSSLQSFLQDLQKKKNVEAKSAEEVRNEIALLQGQVNVISSLQIRLAAAKSVFTGLHEMEMGILSLEALQDSGKAKTGRAKAEENKKKLAEEVNKEICLLQSHVKATKTISAGILDLKRGIGTLQTILEDSDVTGDSISSGNEREIAASQMRIQEVVRTLVGSDDVKRQILLLEEIKHQILVLQKVCPFW